MTEAGIRPRSLTCIPCSRAQVRTASDWPGGATFVTAPVAPASLRVARPGRFATGAEDNFVIAVFLVAAFLAGAFLVAGPRRIVDFDADAFFAAAASSASAWPSGVASGCLR